MKGPGKIYPVTTTNVKGTELFGCKLLNAMAEQSLPGKMTEVLVTPGSIVMTKTGLQLRTNASVTD